MLFKHPKEFAEIKKTSTGETQEHNGLAVEAHFLAVNIQPS